MSAMYSVGTLVCHVLLQLLTTCAPDLLSLSRPVCLAMPLVVDAVWALWSITAGVYDYFHTSAMEERIHTLEHVLSIHQFVIAGLSAGLILLMTYILWRKHWRTSSPWRDVLLSRGTSREFLRYNILEDLWNVPHEVWSTEGATKPSVSIPWRPLRLRTHLIHCGLSVFVSVLWMLNCEKGGKGPSVLTFYRCVKS